jgi:molybdopterin-guanine dinucleotide biosynthesis protein A
MPLHPEEALVIKDELARPSSQATSFFLPYDSPGVGEKYFSQVVTQLHQLTRLISPACDRYIQYLLAGATHRSLTNTGGGLQP